MPLPVPTHRSPSTPGARANLDAPSLRGVRASSGPPDRVARSPDRCVTEAFRLAYDPGCLVVRARKQLVQLLASHGGSNSCALGFLAKMLTCFVIGRTKLDPPRVKYASVEGGDDLANERLSAQPSHLRSR